MLTTILITATIIATLLQCYFWLIRFSTSPRETKKPQPANSTMVSVIICAHNEASNLVSNLPLILSQSYSPFEVVVVDHGSTDKTKIILQGLKERHSALSICYEPYDSPGKRSPLSKGIAAANGEILLLTDADCRPASANWISKMTAPFSCGFDLVLGIAPFGRDTGFLNSFSRWENFVTMQLYSSEAIRQRPFMAVGRNLAYRKHMIQSTAKTEDRHIGGDDDLFINQLGKKHRTQVVFDPSAHMLSSSQDALRSLAKQKRRHVSTSVEYSWQDQLFLFIFAASAWTQLLAILVLALLGHFLLAAIMFLVRLLILIIRIRKMPFQASYYKCHLWLPLVDLSYLIYYPMLTLFLIFQPPKKWN